MRNQTELMRSILTSKTAQKIIDYVSPIYGNSYVGLWLFQAIGTALDDVCDVAEQLRYETNASTAELLLDLWERRYGLPTDSSLTVEQRRARILEKQQPNGACNPARLAAAVSAALGGVKVEITENVARNTFNVAVFGNVDNISPAVAVIERMKPAHLIYNISVSVQTSTVAELKTAVAITHAERYTLRVVEPTDDEPDVYVDNETLIVNRTDVQVQGENLQLWAGAMVSGETLII